MRLDGDLLQWIDNTFAPSTSLSSPSSAPSSPPGSSTSSVPSVSPLYSVYDKQFLFSRSAEVFGAMTYHEQILKFDREIQRYNESQVQKSRHSREETETERDRE